MDVCIDYTRATSSVAVYTVSCRSHSQAYVKMRTAKTGRRPGSSLTPAADISRRMFTSKDPASYVPDH